MFPELIDGPTLRGNAETVSNNLRHKAASRGNSLLTSGVTDADAQRLVSYATRRPLPDFPQPTPRILDHQIWKHQRGRSKL